MYINKSTCFCVFYQFTKYIKSCTMNSTNKTKQQSQQNERQVNDMAYKVKEVIETDREGNRKQKEGTFNTYNQAVFHIKQRMKEIIKQDALKFFRMYGQKITTEKLNSFCNDELVSWLDESDGEQFPYVASCLEWSCFWIIEQKIP